MADYTIVVDEDAEINNIQLMVAHVATMAGELRQSTEDARYYFFTNSTWNGAGGGLANLRGHLNDRSNNCVVDVHVTREDELTDDESSDGEDS